MAFLDPKLVNRLLAKLLQIEKQIRSTRKRELASIAETFEDPQELARVYVEPNCQHHNPTEEDEDEGSTTFLKTGIFGYLENFLKGQDILREGKSQLFVLSDAGMGKTSLLVMIKLSHLMSFWPSSYRCVLLKLGETTLKDVAALPEKQKTVLLLDALDEDLMAFQRTRQRLNELLSATKLLRRVIITCRTQFFPEGPQASYGDPYRVEVAGHVCPIIYLSLFDDDQVEEYLHKRFAKRYKADYDTFLTKARRILAKMHSLKFRPLLLAHIEDLIESRNVEWTEYSVYKALVDAWLLREERKVAARIATAPPTKEQLLTSCLRAAEEMVRNDTRSLSLEDLMALAKRYQQDTYVELFDLKGRSLLNRREDGAFRFSHYSIQEYLIAKGVIENLFARGDVPLRCTDVILRFVLDNRRPDTAFGMLNLERQTLSCRTLPHSNFEGAHLQNAKLVETDFAGAVMTNANFSGANAALAVLSDADLFGAVFSGTILEGARLQGCRAQSATFLGAKCNGADFTKANLKRTDFREAHLENATLRASDLTGALFKGAFLKGCDLSAAILTNADFSGAQLDGCLFDNASLDTPHLKGATFKAARLAKANIKWGDWSRVDLSEADFSHADMRGFILDGACLSKACLLGANLEGAGLRDITLDGAVLDTCNLRGAKFQGCNLSAASLRNIQAHQTHFAGAALAPQQARFFHCL